MKNIIEQFDKNVPDEELNYYYDYVKIFLEARENYHKAKKDLIREKNKRFYDIDKKYYSNLG